MSLYQAFVQELSQLTRGYEGLNRMVCNEPEQTVVIERNNTPALSIIFEERGKVSFAGEHVNTGAKISSTAGMSEESAVSLIIAAMKEIDKSFYSHAAAIEKKAEDKAEIKGNRGPRGMDTI